MKLGIQVITGGSLPTREIMPAIQSAHAILIVREKYVLQLRDDKPNIPAPGLWSLFGGMKKANETPLAAIRREISEELSIEPSKYQYLGFVDYYASFENDIIRTWFFLSDVTELWAIHKLKEGRAASLFSFNEIRTMDMPLVMKGAIENFETQRNRKGVR